MEPLPAESHLWDLPGVVVSPHISAISTIPETLEVLSKNYARFVAGEKLEYEVEWAAGY